MSDYRILVTGSREATSTEDDYVRGVLHIACLRPLFQGRRVVIAQGKCPKGGVDLAAATFAAETDGVADEPHPADWNRGSRAGPVRNSEMVAAGANICLAFPAPDSSGTVDCMTKAWKAGIHVRIYPLRTAPTEETPPR